MVFIHSVFETEEDVI